MVLTKETHESFQTAVKQRGMHKVCFKASNELFNVNANAKYEMSVAIETGHEHKEQEATDPVS